MGMGVKGEEGVRKNGNGDFNTEGTEDAECTERNGTEIGSRKKSNTEARRTQRGTAETEGRSQEESNAETLSALRERREGTGISTQRKRRTRRGRGTKRREIPRLRMPTASQE